MLTLIDNYDSFTYNLVHFLGELGASTRVYRNDKVTVDEVLAEGPEAIVLSPGPCDPDRAGICLDIISRAGPVVPILGVCLGHQAIGQVYGGRVVRAPTLMHGKLSKVHHTGKGLFAGLPQDFAATRYHSLVVERASLPADLEITAETADGIIMGLQHKRYPVHGVQFHPESIASEHGHQLLANFLDLARVERRSREAHTEKRSVPSRVETSSLEVDGTVPPADLSAALAKIASGQTLTQLESAQAFELIMSGGATDAQLGALLMGFACAVRRSTRSPAQRVRFGHGPSRSTCLKALSTPAAPAATPRARTTSRHVPPSWWRAPASPSPSTATARSPRAQARPTCWPR